MPPYQSALHTFLVQSRAKDRARILISLSPPPKRTSPAGRIFILIECPAEAELGKQLSFLTNEFSRFYESHVEDGAENPFEKALEDANRLIEQTIESSIWPKINILAGCLKNSDLQFAAKGEIGAYVIFKEGEEFRHLNLLKGTCAKSESPPFFANLISGELKPDNWAIFCASSVLDFLTADRLKKIILTRPADEACHYLEKTLHQIEGETSFGGLIINLDSQAKKYPKPSPSFRLTPDNSIRRLVRQEQDAEKILSPSFWINLKALLIKHKSPPEGRETDLETIKKITKIYNRLSGWRNTIQKTATKIKTAAGGFFHFLSATPAIRRSERPAAAAPTTTGETGRDKKFPPAAARLIPAFVSIASPPLDFIAQTAKKIKNRFFILPPLRRRLLFGAAAIGAIFFIGLFYSSFQNNRRLEQERYSQQLNRIKENLDQAESSLIYQDEDGARRILKQVRADLKIFPKDSKKRRLAFVQLESLTESIAVKLRHLEKIAPTLVADLTESTASCPPADLIKVQKSFILPCRGGKQMYLLDENKNLRDLSVPGEYKDKTETAGGDILFLLLPNRTVKYNSEGNSFSSREAVWASEGAEIKSIASYASFLYGLDVKNGQISKHRPALDGFSKGSLWLKEKLDLTDSVDLAIDGSIYLSKSGGEIWKLENGRKIDFDLSLLDPAISSAARIWTAPNSQNLYILDSGQKRVIIWNKKENKLAAQFTAEEFDDLRGFWVEEKTKTIFVLDGSRIFNFNLEAKSR